MLVRTLEMTQRAERKVSTEALQKKGIVSRVAMTKGNVRRLTCSSERRLKPSATHIIR